MELTAFAALLLPLFGWIFWHLIVDDDAPPQDCGGIEEPE